MDFRGSKLKVKRAKHHISNFHARMQTFANESGLYKIASEYDFQAGGYSFYVDIIKSLPDSIPLILGDAIHNLRAALDILAYEIVSSGGGDCSRVYFPFSDDRERLEGSGKYRTIQSTSEEAGRLILDEIKPYKTGNQSLWALNQLDILDKHKLIIPVAHATEVSGINAVDVQTHSVFNNITARVGANGRINIALTGNQLEIQNYGNVAIGIFFGPDSFFDSRSIPETLNELAEIVDGIIALFEEADLGLD